MSESAKTESEALDQAVPKIFKYQASGLGFESPVLPNDMLTTAFVRAKQSMGQRAYMNALNREKLKRSADSSNDEEKELVEKICEEIAQAEAIAAAEAVADPFEMEPCAMAVFMFLSRELEYRDLIIEQMSERLVILGASPLDVKHPYPTKWPEPPPEGEAATGESTAALAEVE